MGVNCETGATVWETPNPLGWKMSHASIVPMILNGKRMYVYAAVGGVCGVSADADDTGRILWSSTDWAPSVVAPSPVVLGDGRIFCTAGYGAGSIMLKVTESGGSYAAETLYKLKPRDGLACEQQTPLYYKGHLFAVMPKDGAKLRNQLVCWDPEGKVVWSSDAENRFGIGPLVIADGKFYILDDDGVLTMAEASVTEYRQLAQAKVLDGHDSWAPPAIVAGRMLIRDSLRMVCLDLR
jgi:outer membrane protein assembly factor BamB